MKVLLAGANGYIGTRLIPVLLENGHDVVCLIRDKRRFHEHSDFSGKVTLITGDLLKESNIEAFPEDLDAAYYLVHSMVQTHDFAALEALSAHNFVKALDKTRCKQTIFLSGITNDENLSRHLESRRHVEDVLKEGKAALTVLRAAIIIGSGSASFEIIRDLTEKLPVMTVPRWVNTKSQPIGIRDVLGYLEGVMLNEKSYNRAFDIGGPDILSFRQMMLTYAEVRKLKRYIITIPFLSPKISSYWLYFVTSTSFTLAQSLVNSMKNETIMHDHSIDDVVPRKCLTYEECLELAFVKIEQNSIVSSWKDAFNQGYLNPGFMDQIKVPQNGTQEYKVKMPFERPANEVFTNVLSIGGNRGWYYWDWIWNIRGFLDKIFGGVGSRRGRTSNIDISPGDAIDFWRVLLTDRENKRLLLYAEMKLPGEAWLEFKIIERHGKQSLSQVATFRPNGLWGRLYWYAMWPFHLFIFKGMAREIVNYKEKAGTIVHSNSVSGKNTMGKIMDKSILLTGGSGLLGTHLTKALLAKGYTVSHLSRNAGNNPQVKTFVWDINKGIIDEHCIDGIDTIVHLAGSGIAEKHWTDARKKDLIDSRVKSIELVYDLLKRKQHQVTSVISASGIGYYSDRGDELMYETSAPARDFISQCCVLWEAAVDEGQKFGVRILKFRTGVVLDKDGGALPTLAKPIKLYVGSPIGSGKQWVPWIHWQDVVDMYLLGIENKDLSGVYNMVAPNPVTNKQLTQAVAKQLHKPLWAPNVPGFVLKLLLGEMSSIVLGSTKVSAQKIEDAGFKFKFTDLEAALSAIYGS